MWLRIQSTYPGPGLQYLRKSRPFFFLLPAIYCLCMSTPTTPPLPPSFTPAPAPVPGLPTSWIIDKVKCALPLGQYMAESQTKTQIVMHFTAGSTAAGAYSSWASTPERVGTAYIIDRKGATFECFRPEFWAAHLGVTATDGNVGYRYDRQSIGIELVNWGRLTVDKQTGKLINWLGLNFPSGVLRPEEALGAVNASYRGGEWWQAFTPEQIAAARALVGLLCVRFAIPQTVPPANKRLVYDPKYAGDFRGIVGHQMYHREKTDPGPAFPWEQFRKGVV